MNDRPQSGSKIDIRQDHWMLGLLPERFQPYGRLARLDRPFGTWLLLLPGWLSILMADSASGQTISLWYLVLFALGAFLMRGAGCTVNDYFDRDIDGAVERTSTRPIPAGEVTPTQALIFLAGLLGVSLIILLQFNWTAIALGAVSLALVIPYPLMKRITYWPQAWLGLTFNWGALLGWTAVTGEIGLPAILLYLGGVAWTLGYDTIYAHADKDDDLLIGVKSTALALGEQTRPWVGVFYIVTLCFWFAAGNEAGMAWPYFAALAGVAAHFCWQVVTLDINTPANCLARIKSNRDAGLILFLGALLAHGLG